MEIITKETAQYIADTLGIALKDVFTIYSESIKALAMIDMVTTAIWVVMSIIVCVLGYYLNKGINGGDTFGFLFVIWLIFTIALVGINDQISQYYCSDYYAIKELIGIVE